MAYSKNDICYILWNASLMETQSPTIHLMADFHIDVIMALILSPITQAGSYGLFGIDASLWRGYRERNYR